MAEILNTNKTALRGCILYEFLQGKPVDEAYKSFCKTIGNEVIEQKEFENWFNCFANGKYDLEDESFDKVPKSFSDLPNVVLGEIVGNLDLVSRLRTRKVSLNLRSVVDEQKAHYYNISIDTMPKQIDIQIDQNKISYMENDGKCAIEYQCDGMESKKKFLNGDFLKIALNDLEIAMKESRLQLEHLSLSFYKNSDFEKDKILNLLKSLRSLIHVKSLQIGDDRGKDVLSILSLTKPGTLEKIAIGGMNPELNVNELVEMDHWKQAKKVNVIATPIEIEHCIQFERFDVSVKSLSTQDVLRLQDILSKSTKFKYCVLNAPNIDSIIDEIGAALGATVSQGILGSTIRHRQQIPGSNEFLDFNIDGSSLTIKRTQ